LSCSWVEAEVNVRAVTTPIRRAAEWTAATDGRFAFTLALPVVAVLLLINAWPFLYSVVLSLIRVDYISHVEEFVGFGNFARVLGDAENVRRTLTTLSYGLQMAALSMLVALGSAVLLNEAFPGRGVLRALVVLPWAVSTFTAAVVWRYMYSPDFGFLSSLLLALTGSSEAVQVINTQTAVTGLAVAHAWQFAPLGTYFIMAALQAIPQDLYRLAKSDRLGAWGRFRHVTLPSIRTPLVFFGVLALVDALRSFDIPYFVTAGGPAGASETLSFQIYRRAIVQLDLGYGAAIGWVLVVLILVVATVYALSVTRLQRMESSA
jgi:ABC-type sugar transport system permease subunit